MRGLLLWMVAMLVVGGSALARNIPEHVEAAEPVAMEHRELIIPHTTTPAPARPDFDLQHLSVCTGSNVASEAEPAPAETMEPEEILTEEEETLTEATDAPEPTCLGAWTITAYCPCEICCGEYASGYTASGTLAMAGRTAACNILPFGTQVMIDGVIYTIEDTGAGPCDEWIDIFFDTHDEALAFGMQEKEVYIIG